MRRVFVPLLVFPFLVVLMGGHPVLYDPGPIEIPEDLTAEKVAGCIRYALEGRGWTVESVKMPEGEKPGEVNSTLYIRSHTLTIRIIFDDKKADIEYTDSTNLDYKPKKNRIHAQANRWLQYIEKDIRRMLSKERLEKLMSS
jgi:hypothetical protein